MFARRVRGLALLALTAGLYLGMPGRSFAADSATPDKGAADAAKAEAKPGDKAEAKAEAKAKKGKSKEEKRKDPLPAYYRDLTDGEQRAKIYEIQAQHEPEIKKLKAALSAAIATRDAAMLAVLTPAQQEKLATLQAEAKAKRVKKPMEGKGDGAKTASAKPVKKPATDAAESKTEK